PSLFESPEDLRIRAPVMKRFGHGERFVDAAPGLEAPIHHFRLPFHKRETSFRVRAFPFVKQIAAVNLRARVAAGFVRPERARRTKKNGLCLAQIEGIFKTRNPNE